MNRMVKLPSKPVSATATEGQDNSQKRMVCLQAAPRAVLAALVKLLGEPLLQQADAARVPGLLATLISIRPTLLVRKTPSLATGTQASTWNRQAW